MTTNTPPTHEDLLRRIRELEKEVAHWRNQVSHQQYGLVWMDVPEAFDTESLHSIPILEEEKHLSFCQDDGKPTHVLIEGDNYHSLTCLNYTHRNSIDVIYIDPPYNTGNDGFTYKDSRFITKQPDGQPLKKNHPLRHSAWLSFMAKRLRLAKELLKEDGVIFISIGNNELAQLNLLAHQIWEEQNSLGIVTRIQKKGSDKGNFFTPSADYILAYAKNATMLNKFFQPITASFPLLETEGKHKGEYYEASKSLYQSSLDSRPNQRYYIECPDGSFVIPPGNVFPSEIKDGAFVIPNSNKDKCWRWSWDSYLEKKDRIVFKRTKRSPLLNEKGESASWNVYTKRYEKEAAEKGNVPPNIIEDCINALGTNRLSDLGIDFPFPKPVELVSKLIQITNKKKDLKIVDFFAGSGTTLDAVLQLNAKDGGRRQCILCQASEADICRSVTLERNRRVMQGYTNAKGEEVQGLGGSLKYYRTAFVGRNTAREASDADRIDLAARAGCLLALAENTLYETERAERFQFFTDHDGRHTAIYFNEDYSDFPAFETHMRSLTGSTAIYVFSWGDGTEFAPMFDDLPNVVVKSIPQPILDIYKSLNP